MAVRETQEWLTMPGIRAHAGAVLTALAVLLGTGARDTLAAGDDTGRKPDKEMIKGTWKVLSSEADGVDQPALANARLSFDDTGFAFGHEGQSRHRGTFTLGDSARPRTIDLTFTEGPHAGDRMLGIYDWDGDHLKLCVTDPSGTNRPKEFTTTVASGLRLFVLKKDEP
jgi:uncharacterized protein (TIGR03067 family)